MNAYTKSEYRRLRARGYTAETAIRCARIADAWTNAENEGLVRLRLEPDEEMYDDSYIDTWDDQTERQREHAKAELWRTIEREGVWGLITEYLDGDTWEHASSCWGFIGEPDEVEMWDAKEEALDALDKVREREAGELAVRATYAMVAT